MNERLISSSRRSAQSFVRFVRTCAMAAAHDREDTQNAARLIALAETIRQRMAVSTCSLEDILRAIDNAQPSGSVLDEVVPDEDDEPTRPSSPGAMPAKPRGWWPW